MVWCHTTIIKLMVWCLIKISKEEEFEFGDLNDAIPEIDAEATSFTPRHAIHAQIDSRAALQTFQNDFDLAASAADWHAVGIQRSARRASSGSMSDTNEAVRARLLVGSTLENLM